MVSKLGGARQTRALFSSALLLIFLGFYPQNLKAQNASLDELRKRLPSLPNVDGSSLSSLELGCRKSGPELPGYYPCDSQNGKPGFKSRVEFYVQNMVASLVDDLYSGVTPNLTTGASKLSPTPVCNLGQNETDKDFKGRSCGEFCELKVETSLTSGSLTVNDKNGHCDREYGWIRGGHVQAIYDSYEKVMQSFKSGTYQLVSVDGVHPNGEYAADVLRVQTAHKGVLDEIIAKKGEDKVSKLTCKVRDLAGSFKAGDQVVATPESHGACRLKMGGMELVSMWAKLLVSEIQWKAAMAMDETIGQDPTQLIKKISQGTEKACAKEADCGITCSDAERTKRLTPCYQQQVKKKMEEIFAPFKGQKVNRQAKPVAQFFYFIFGDLNHDKV